MRINTKLAVVLFIVIALAPIISATYHSILVSGYDIQAYIDRVVINAPVSKVIDVDSTAYKYTIKKFDNVQNFALGLTAINNPQYKGKWRLHSENGSEYLVYVWDIDLSLSIKAYDAQYIMDWLARTVIEEPNTITVYIRVDSRIKFAILDAWVTNITKKAWSSEELARYHKLWWWGCLIDGKTATQALTPKINEIVPIENYPRDYPKDPEKALEALRLPKTFWISCRISVTAVQAFYSVFIHPSELIYNLRLRIALIEKIDPTVAPEERKPEDPTLNPPPGAEVPWWAYWIYSLVVMAGFFAVMLLLVKAGVFASPKVSLILGLLMTIVFFVTMYYIAIPALQAMR